MEAAHDLSTSDAAELGTYLQSMCATLHAHGDGERAIKAGVIWPADELFARDETLSSLIGGSSASEEAHSVQSLDAHSSVLDAEDPGGGVQTMDDFATATDELDLLETIDGGYAPPLPLMRPQLRARNRATPLQWTHRATRPKEADPRISTTDAIRGRHNKMERNRIKMLGEAHDELWAAICERSGRSHLGRPCKRQVVEIATRILRAFPRDCLDLAEIHRIVRAGKGV